MEEVLKMGSTGEKVRQLQENLTVLGFPLQNIDGIFGEETRAAVISFQNYSGLKPDGIVGSRTTKALENVDELGYGSGILTPQGFETLENALDSSKKETRYWAAITLADNFNAQTYFRCVPSEIVDRNPCKPDLVIIASDKMNESQPVQYKEVKLPVGKMLSVMNEALGEEDQQLVFTAAVAQTWIRQEPTQKVVNILLKNGKNQDESMSDQAFSSLELIARNPDNIKFFTPDVVENLIDVFQEHPEKVFQTLNYLSASGNAEALQTIENFLVSENNININPYYYEEFASISGLEQKQTVFNILNQVIENKSKKIEKDIYLYAAIEALVGLNCKPNPELKNQAIDTLKKILSTSEVPEVRFEAALALAEIGIPKEDLLITSEVVKTLTKVLQKQEKLDVESEEMGRFYAAGALGKIAKEIEQEKLNIIKILKAVVLEKNSLNADDNADANDADQDFDPIAEVRFEAASALAEIGGEEAETFLKDILRQSEIPDPLRMNVALAVSKFDLNSALPVLITMYKNDPRIRTVHSPACTLVQIEDQDKKDAVVNALDKVSQEYQALNLQEKSKETQQVIQYIKDPSINFAFNPCGGIGDDPDPILTTFKNAIERILRR